jgi:hypothetical protein
MPVILVTVAVSSLKDVVFIGHRIEYIRCPDSCKNVPKSQRGLRVDLNHPVVLLTDLGRVRDFMLEPEYTQEEVTTDAVRQIQMMIYRLENPSREWIPLPDNLGDTAKMFL